MNKILELTGLLRLLELLPRVAEYLKDRWTILQCRYYDFKYRKYYESPEFLRKLDEAIEEAERIAHDPNVKGYNSAEELHAAIMAEPDDEDE